MIQLKRFAFNPFSENTYVLYDETGEAVIVDPGCYEQAEQDQLVRFMSEKQLTLKKIICTHCHVDHILGVDFVKTRFKVDFFCHQNESFLVEGAVNFGNLFGLQLKTAPSISGFISEGEIVAFGNTKLEAIYVPGHSPGSICFYSHKDGVVITGDVLFQGSIGRSDLPGGDHHTLIDGIKKKLMTLPRNTAVYSGHGEPTSIGMETDTNPFLN